MGSLLLLEFLLPTLLYGLGFILLTWPVVQSFATHYWCDTGDGLQNVWNLWWVERAVSEGRSPWQTDMLFHPDGVTLISQTLNPFNGFLAIPLRQMMAPEAAFNCIVLFGFVGTGLTTYWLARHLQIGRGVALWAGAAFTFCQSHFAHAYGHLQLVSLEFLPLFVLLWLRFLERPRTGRALAAAVTLFFVLLCDHYYAFYCVVSGALLFAVRSLRAGDPWHYLRPGRLAPTLVFTATAATLLLPLLVGLLRADAADPFTGEHDPKVFSLDLLAGFVPGAFWRFGEWTQGFWLPLSGNPVENSVYFGAAVLLPAAWAVLRGGAALAPWRRSFALVAVVFFVLSLGSVFRVAGQAFPDVPTPYGILEWLVPPLQVAGMPSRMVVMTQLALTLLAAFALREGIARGTPRTRLIGTVAFLALWLFETLPREQTTTAADQPDWVAALDDLPEGAVGGTSGSPPYLLLQTRFERPIELGYTTRTPESLAGRAAHIATLRRAGRFREWMETYDLRYLLLDKFAPERRQRGFDDLEPVFLGDRHELFVLREDPLPGLQRPDSDCASGAPLDFELRPDDRGRPSQLHVHAPADGGRNFIVGFSLTAEPWIELPDGRTIPLHADPLYRQRTDRGTLDGAGHGVLDLSRLWEVPELRGQTVLFAVGVRDPNAPSELCRISKRGQVEVR